MLGNAFTIATHKTYAADDLSCAIASHELVNHYWTSPMSLQVSPRMRGGR